MSAPPETVVELRVGGLRCSSCAMGLRLGLLALDGVNAVNVDIDGGRVVVHGRDQLDERRLRDQLCWLGYAAEPR